MSDSSAFSLGDSWLGQAGSWLGNQFGDAAGWVGNQLGLTGDSGAASGATSGAATPSSFGGINFGGSSAGGVNSSFGSPTSLEGTPAASANNLFMAPGATSSTSAYSGSGTNPDSIMAGSGGGGGAAAGGSSPATKSIMESLGLSGKDLLKAGISGGGLLTSLAMGSPTSGAEKQLKSMASSQGAQGQQLQSYIANGTLPPGAQQWVDNQSAAQSASIRAKYANLGMSGSTAEMQELNQVQANAASQMFQIASELLNTGITETNASGTLYNYLMQAEDANQKDVSSAIQNFVASLSGGGAPKSINVNI